MKNIINNLSSNIALSSIAKCECRKTVYFTELNVLLKQPIRIGYLVKQNPRGALALKQERIRRVVSASVSTSLFG